LRLSSAITEVRESRREGVDGVGLPKPEEGGIGKASALLSLGLSNEGVGGTGIESRREAIEEFPLSNIKEFLGE
jgi:hypothetical protein